MEIVIAEWPKFLGEPEISWVEYQRVNHGVLNYSLLVIRADAAIDDLVSRLEQAERALGATEGAVIKLQDELMISKVNLKLAEKQRDRAEQKYDGACAMMTASRGPDGWEVVEAGDGELSIQVVDWKGRAEKAEATLAELAEGDFHES